MAFNTSTVPERLKDAARNGVLVPFVGAGFSKQADTADRKAFPNWTELLAELRDLSVKQKYMSPDEAKQVDQLVSKAGT